TLPTIRWVIAHGGRVIVVSHLGRPKGTPTPEFSLAPVAEYLRRALGTNVTLAPDCVGDETERLGNATKPGDVVLLENLRFHPQGEKNEPAFAAPHPRRAHA